MTTFTMEYINNKMESGQELTQAEMNWVSEAIKQPITYDTVQEVQTVETVTEVAEVVLGKNEVLVKDNMDLFEEVTEVNKHGNIGYKLKGAKRFSSASVKEDKKGTYFISKKIKYYI